MIKESEIQPFYLYSRLTAVLEQGARVQGQIPWLELYYPRGFLPWVGLRRAPAQAYAVRPALPGAPGTLRQLPRPPQLAGQRPASAEPAQDPASFDSWCTRYLSHDRSPKPDLPLKSTPRDAPLYAQGYLVERQTLQPQRPPLPGDEDVWQFCWDYHQGRLLTWNIAGNEPRLPTGFQQALADRPSLATREDKSRKTLASAQQNSLKCAGQVQS